MSVTSRIMAGACAVSVMALSGLAEAHISVSNPVGFANVSQEVNFSVGHGCGTMDTFRIKVSIPPGVVSIRTLTSDFGPATLTKVADEVTAVTWQKPVADVLPEDTGYYKLTIRARLPNTPFTTLYFPIEQTCRAPNGTTTVVMWDQMPGDPVPDGGHDTPAASLNLVPARSSGWNKYTVPVGASPDVQVFFKDAAIVWKGSAAYSSSTETAALIAGTTGVTPLTGVLAAGDVLWVKY